MVQQDTRVAVESSLEGSMRYFAGIVDTGIVDTIGCWMDMSSSDKNSKAVVAL